MTIIFLYLRFDSGETSSRRVRLLVSLVHTYGARRDKAEYWPNDIELKLYLELSLNALYKLVLTLQSGETISPRDIDYVRADVLMLIECSISELFAMQRCKGNPIFLVLVP